MAATNVNPWIALLRIFETLYDYRQSTAIPIGEDTVVQICIGLAREVLEARGGTDLRARPRGRPGRAQREDRAAGAGGEG